MQKPVLGPALYQAAATEKVPEPPVEFCLVVKAVSDTEANLVIFDGDGKPEVKLGCALVPRPAFVGEALYTWHEPVKAKHKKDDEEEHPHKKHGK